MIYGKPDALKFETEQERIKNEICFGVKCFAWLPVTLADGSSLWLESYWAYARGGAHARSEKDDEVIYFIFNGSRETYSPQYDRYATKQQTRSLPLPKDQFWLMLRMKKEQDEQSI